MNTNYKFVIKRIKEAYTKQGKFKPSNKYIILYRAIKDCITNTELPNNWLLPSTRVLAQELELSRTTVNKAYELLQLEKLIFSKAGSGNRISYEDLTEKEDKKIIKTNNTLYPNISEKGISYSKNISLLNRMPNNNLAFRPGLPPIDAFPVNQWKKLLNTYWRHIKSSNLSYSNSTGLLELKKSICDYLNVSRNIKCNYEQIVIVSGSLQSLYLIANALIDKGDSVVLENPVFPNAHSVFKSSQANLIPVSLDNDGIDIKKIKAIKKKTKLIHLTPSNHYPLGIKMSLKRRQDILKWASQQKALIIENDYENEIANHLESIPSIFSLDKEDRTIYIGTFNRLLHPSIRLGYMIIPKYLINTIEALQEHSHRFVSPFIQVVMTQFIEKNYLYKHIRNTIEIAKDRHNFFVNEFNTISTKMHINQNACSSFHVVANFKSPTTIDEEEQIISKLNQQNITAHSLSKCYIGNPKKTGLIFGYSAVRPSIIKQKLKKMKGLI
ncbi:PLP-dependent aminotransferase family protein [Winogradskyella sp. UBA3174]|uniref:MocR-like pyridoxine biosynthesis transcription factor PdxR n=1 Tax=Winogradskyella sp. UBA3174 TaxID=1947785 RepID=UPI0025F800B4|nr:PLP-dependent aminotransferase family protein [Winogradskyella sp. UBA3174]|tara:strand:+ start:11887 stop:13377 length:1491 start_codon:yes stop_codon:yes gene_type:complete